MSLSDVAIKRPVFTSMMSVCLLVLGVMGLKRLGTDLFPDVSFPVVTVTTVYRGAGTTSPHRSPAPSSSSPTRSAPRSPPARSCSRSSSSIRWCSS